MKQWTRIAIDGPAAAGKSTVAKRVAAHYGYIYIDTGAMYRAFTYYVLDSGICVSDEEQVKNLLETFKMHFSTDEDGVQRVIVNGKDVSEDIRLPDVTGNVSEIAAYSSVRKALVSEQQQMAQSANVVMDGRDIGTHVIPDAEVKIFLVASVEERAQRRYQENMTRGITTPIQVLQKEIADRDHYDSTRKVSPLKKAEDAILLDTSSLSIQEVTDKILSIVDNLR
ncbi:MAG: (d)CMP kinase [Bacilli bacterium]